MIDHILLSEETIARRLDVLAKEIDTAYAGKDLLAVGILKGSVFFLTDLLKRLKVPVSVDFLQVRSYAGTSSSGNITSSTTSRWTCWAETSFSSRT